MPSTEIVKVKEKDLLELDKSDEEMPDFALLVHVEY